MRVIIQRVVQASVSIYGVQVDSIGQGLMILVGVDESDVREDLEWLVQKIANLRVFNDKDEKMNLSIIDTRGDILLVSQFTLHASTKKGNRPSFIKAAKPELAKEMYEQMKEQLYSVIGKPIHSGLFGANMQVSLVNDGPVTIFIDTKNKE